MNLFEAQYWQAANGQPAIGATITFSADPEGTQPIQCYDLQGNPTTLTTAANPPGWQPQFQADAVQGYLSAGGQAIQKLSNDWIVQRLSGLDQLQQQVSSVSSDASAAVALASSANATASQAQAATNPQAGDSGVTQAQLDAV